MKRFLAAAMGFAFSTAAMAQDEDRPSYDLYCRATHEFACNATSCESEGGDSIYVGVSVVLASGTGNICTYTYCRDFMLVPNPGDSTREAVERWSGFTLSESSGSTEDYIGRPVIDYQLSISEDHTRFVLGGAENGGFGGWAGVCGPRPQE